VTNLTKKEMESKGHHFARPEGETVIRNARDMLAEHLATVSPDVDTTKPRELLALMNDILGVPTTPPAPSE